MRINDIVASSQGFQESLYCENFIYPAFTTLRDSVCVGIVGPFSLYAWVLYFLTFMMCPGVYFGIIGAKRQLPDAETELDGSNFETIIGEEPIATNYTQSINMATFGAPPNAPPMIGFNMAPTPLGHLNIVNAVPDLRTKPFSYVNPTSPEFRRLSQ